MQAPRSLQKLYADGWGWNVSISGMFKDAPSPYHALMFSSHDTNRSRSSPAHALQQRCAGPYALSHTYIYIYLYIRGDARHSCTQQTAAASLIDPIIRPGNLCCSSSSSGSSDGGSLGHRGLLLRRLPTDRSTQQPPRPEHWLRPPTGKPLLINQGIWLQRNHSPDVAERLLEQLRLQDVLRRRESPVEM